MTEISRIQKRRAENIIWNSASDYSFTPDFKSFDSDGKAELYWNCIIGSARKQYEYEKLEKIFQTFDLYEEGDIYNALLWLGLENALYQKELAERPALKALRNEYTQLLIKDLEGADSSQLYDYMALLHFKRALGIEINADEYSTKLLDELEFSPDMTTDDIVERAAELFERWFQITTNAKKKQRKFISAFVRKKQGTEGKNKKHRFGRGFADHPKDVYGGSDSSRKIEDEEIKTKLSADELREFMESKFGEPMFSSTKMVEIERNICCGGHQGCSLLFTRGEVAEWKIRNAFEALQKQKEAQQIQKNRQSFYDNYSRNMIAISSLTSKIQNSVLLHLQASDIRSDSGRIDPRVIWRADKLNDDRVFIRREQDDLGNLSVDILLDASTSQKHRQEIVSTQGYLIAESLSRCGIPCRVMSFCSMTGYTILRVFRDYTERGKNEKIFDYVSNGCNRDGLGIRAAHYLMNGTPYEHKVLIILSDVKPNDVKKIRERPEQEAIPYEQGAGLTDTAYEVRRARADGIAVICVFTGADEDIPSAKMVYGRDFAKIQSLDKFADTVGMLIQNQIKIL